MIIYIYNQQTQLIAQPLISSYEEFKNNPTSFYPDWNSNLISSTVKYSNPVIDNGELREKTRYELIISGKEKLSDGEVIQDQELIYIPIPENMIKPKWFINQWKETATEEDFYEANRLIYIEELKLAPLAEYEYTLGLISSEDIDEVNYYLISIHPDNRTDTLSTIERPKVFDRYKRG